MRPDMVKDSVNANDIAIIGSSKRPKINARIIFSSINVITDVNRAVDRYSSRV